ncbi:MAG TPA: carboxypeptidase-like regulatory domain-containing protein, partial [Terriglobia bacterium]|nr:carboxypeptidase-like regulatory domain-containing protein [Terriglobia bacterium]
MKVMKQGIGGSLLFIAATAALVAGAAQAPRGQRGVDPRNSTFINGAPPETLPPILPAPAGNGQTGDRPQPVRVATGAIIGVVTRAGTMEGLSRARVELVPLELTGLDALAVLEPDPAAQKELRARNNYRTADADRDGRFLMSGVRPGRYTLIAEREGFIRSAYGQRGVNQYGSVVVVDPGKTVEVVVPMRPAPAVTGIVTDPVQAPVPAALVEAYRVRYTPIGRELKLAQTAVTGDRGEYRLAWLSPGDYYVAASYSSAYSASGSGLPRNPNIAIHDDGYRAMYFPGGPTLADARIVRVEGSDIDGINMAFQSSKVVSIKGRVAGVQSDFSSVQLTFLGSDGDPVPGLTYPHRVDASGQFEIRGV